MSKHAFSVNRLDSIQPYKPSNQAAWFLPDNAEPLKLDWNESPLPPSPKVFQALTKFLQRPNSLNWYPDADSRELRDMLARHWKVGAECVQTYCGSDSALHAAARIFTRAGETVLMVSPTYDNFRIYALEAECKVVLDGPEDIYSLSGTELAALAAKHRPRMIYLANPNNPTGWLVPAGELTQFAKSVPETMIVVDEAYAEYSGVTVIPESVGLPNLLVCRTFSKAYGLAGLRLGYVIASSGNIETLNLIRNGKNVSMVGQIAAMAALSDHEFLSATLNQVRKGQEILEAGLNKLGIPFRASPANFVLIHLKDSQRVMSALSARHIYVRSMSHLPGMTGYVRITLGNPAQMERFVSALSLVV